MRLAATIAALVSAVAVSCAALAQSDAEAFGPAIGADVSDVVAGADSTGAQHAFADLVGESGLVLSFSRSVDWCPFCKAQAIAIDASYDAFAERGYAVAFLTTDGPDRLAPFVAERAPKLALIGDPDAAAVRALGLLDPSFPEGDPAHGLPFPTTLVLSADGLVQAKLFMEDLLGEDGSYRERVEVADVLAAIDALD